MSQRKRIAICISGQTRHINNPKYTQDFYKILDLFNEYDYDLFGHTWSDHEDPHSEVLDKFIAYRSDDQEIIWDNIIDTSADNYTFWWQFLNWQHDWNKNERYINAFNGKSDESFGDIVKELINGTVGQVWSAHESFLLTKGYNKPDSPYAVVVRLRWDLSVKDNPKQILQFKEVLYNFSNRVNEYASGEIASVNCLAANDVTINEHHDVYFNDQMFVFTAHGGPYNKILSNTPIQQFNKLLRKKNPSRRSHYVLPASHSLWVEWILSAGFKVSPVLPDIFQANGPSEGKTNKVWGI